MSALMVGSLEADQKGKAKGAKEPKAAAKKAAGKKPAAPSTENAQPQKRKFTVYEHIHTRGRPNDLTPYGLVPIQMSYNTKTKQAVQASVKKKFKEGNGGPIVFDIEKTNRSDNNVSTKHLREVAKWAHEAVPGAKIGFYAVGPSNLTPLKRPIEKHVDAFFPSMYIHNTNGRMFTKTAKKLVTQGHRHGKPVYLYLMPKFHGKKGHEIPAQYWAFMLRAAYNSGADGIVIWASDKYTWHENSGWWAATKKFMKQVKADQAKKKTP
jgi:hypothetical protein